MKRLRLAVVGWSKAGSAVAGAFRRSADIIAVWNRSPLETRDRMGLEGVLVDSLESSVSKQPDVVLIGVADAAILEVRDHLASILDRSSSSRPSALIHLSGALPSSVLKIDGRTDVGCGSVHPIRSFASRVDHDQGLEGCSCGIEGDAFVRDILTDWVRSAGGRPLSVDGARKSEYHLASSIASNAMLGVLDLAVTKMVASGVERSEAERALIGLARGTLDNAGKVGIDRALTGPILRGDCGTVRAHLGALENSPIDRSAYVAAALRQLAMAMRRHPERRARYDEIEKMLRSEGTST